MIIGAVAAAGVAAALGAGLLMGRRSASQPVRQAPLTDDERRALQERPTCSHCGGWHAMACPRVKRMTFTAGQLTEVEFFRWDEWPRDDVLFQHELPAGEETTE